MARIMKSSGRKVIIAGNIAAGKTTLCRQLEAEMPALKLCEEKIVSLHALPSFYEEMAAHPGRPNKHAYALQREFLELRYQNELCADQSPAPLVLMDRSIHEDRHVFAEALKEEGAFSEEHFAAYLRAFDTHVAKVAPPAMIVYLRTSTATLLERIRARGREFEQQITPEYLDRLTAHYNLFISHCAALLPGSRVAVVETDGLSPQQVAELVWTHLRAPNGVALI